MKAETKEIGQVETVPRPEPGDPATGGDYRVILYNDDWHDLDEVILQLQKAAGYDLERAARIVFEVNDRGRAECYRGSRDECHRVARVLREIRLQVEVDCD